MSNFFSSSNYNKLFYFYGKTEGKVQWIATQLIGDQDPHQRSRIRKRFKKKTIILGYSHIQGNIIFKILCWGCKWLAVGRAGEKLNWREDKNGMNKLS